MTKPHCHGSLPGVQGCWGSVGCYGYPDQLWCLFHCNLWIKIVEILSSTRLHGCLFQPSTNLKLTQKYFPYYRKKTIKQLNKFWSGQFINCNLALCCECIVSTGLLTENGKRLHVATVLTVRPIVYTSTFFFKCSSFADPPPYPNGPGSFILTYNFYEM